MKYRIITNGSYFKVQRRILFFFWEDCTVKNDRGLEIWSAYNTLADARADIFKRIDLTKQQDKKWKVVE